MPQHDIVLYAYTFPSRAERVIWMLNELELSYELIRLDPFKGETATEDFKLLAPMRKIPVLKHNGKVHTESLAIMEYLHQLKPGKHLVPDAAESVYEFRHLMYFMLSELEGYLWLAHQSAVLGKGYPWPKGTSDEANGLVKRNIKHLFDKIDDKEFLIGNRFSMVDIVAHHMLKWSQQHNIELAENAERYMLALEARPAYPSL
ncbi:MAG: glutathione S-transferase family protein [Agarilytica sp.]